MDRTVCTRCKTRVGLVLVEAGAGGGGANGNATNHKTTTAIAPNRTCRAAARVLAPGHVKPAPAPGEQPRPRRLAEAAAAPAPVPAPAVPDAAPRRGENAFRATAHAVVLLSVVGFVVAYCVVIPVRGQMIGRRDAATVMVVADPLLAVRGPDVSGLFHAVRPLAHGERVRKGQLLGHVSAPRLDDELAAASLEWSGLQERLLRLEQWNAVHAPAPQDAQEARELAARLEAAGQSLARMEKLRSRLAVYAPADGTVQQGLAAAFEVSPHQSIVSLYPDRGCLRLEVSAPLEVLAALQRDGRVSAEFATPGGVTKVAARPMGSSLRHFVRMQERGREELWGTMQCVPDELPPELRAPGAIGKLGS